jgi:hypothetical protein
LNLRSRWRFRPVSGGCFQPISGGSKDMQLKQERPPNKAADLVSK